MRETKEEDEREMGKDRERKEKKEKEKEKKPDSTRILSHSTCAQWKPHTLPSLPFCLVASL